MGWLISTASWLLHSKLSSHSKALLIKASPLLVKTPQLCLCVYAVGANYSVNEWSKGTLILQYLVMANEVMCLCLIDGDIIASVNEP